MKIQPLVNNDLEQVKELQPPDWSDIIPIHKYYLSSGFCRPIKIMIDNRLAGIGTAIIHPDTAWLAHIIVHPDFRNRGMGKFITRYLIETGISEGKKTIYLLATDLGASVYESLGFETEIEYAFYKDGNCNMNPDTDPGIQAYEAKYKSQLIQLDRLSSGEDRAFRLEEFLAGAYLYIMDQKVKGYYIPQLGEGLVIAEDITAGIALMRLRLKHATIAVLPRSNQAASKFLLENNYTEFRKAKRMRLGMQRPWQPHYYYNRISGQLG